MENRVIQHGLSIVTSTYNSEKTIKRLIDDLNAQTDANFTWIVSDCNSDDNTVNLIHTFFKGNLDLISEPDRGIYEGLNKAIGRSAYDFYLVVGSDDRLYSSAVRSIRQLLFDSTVQPDCIVNSIELGNSVRHAFFNSVFYFIGADRIVTGHSVGMVINKKLHEQVGYYRTDLALASDADFIYSLRSLKPKIILNRNLVGRFNIEGSSNRRRMFQICETLIVQWSHSKWKIIPFMIFCYRILRHWSKLN